MQLLLFAGVRHRWRSSCCEVRVLPGVNIVKHQRLSSWLFILDLKSLWSLTISEIRPAKLSNRKLEFSPLYLLTPCAEECRYIAAYRPRKSPVWLPLHFLFDTVTSSSLLQVTLTNTKKLQISSNFLKNRTFKHSWSSPRERERERRFPVSGIYSVNWMLMCTRRALSPSCTMCKRWWEMFTLFSLGTF